MTDRISTDRETDLRTLLTLALALLTSAALAQSTVTIPAQTVTVVIPAQTVTLPASSPAPTPTPVPASGTFWVYHAGVFNWGGDYSFGGLTANYQDTQGKPRVGPFDISCSLHGQWGGFLPFAGGIVPLWNFDATPYNALTFAFKPTIANQTAQVYFIKVNDIPVGIVVDPFSGKYGPKPLPGVWGVYSIPLADLGVKGTSIYKFAIQDQTGSSSNVFYLDDIGFTK